MGKNLLVINVDFRETRVALIEGGILAELHIERESSRGTLGNIYLGKVSRVLPGMQAAFIDVGLERAAFLHVEDLIRPDDFEAYLSGGNGRPREEEDDEGTAEGAEDGATTSGVGGDERAAAGPEPEGEEAADADGALELADATEGDEPPEGDDDEDGEEAPEPAGTEEPSPPDERGLVAPPLPGEAAVAEEGALRTKRVADKDHRVRRSVHVGRGRRRRGGREGGSGGREGGSGVRTGGSEGRQGARAGRDGRGRGGRDRGREPARISKTTPIRDVVREGQDIVVQISKEPIGTKGARVTSHIALPGRYVVYMPTLDHVGISKRIGSEKERSRLRDAIDTVKPPTGGLIVRTLAEGLTKKQLKADVGYLVRLWAEVAKKREGGARAPAVLYTELDLVLKTARDLFGDDVEKIVIDDRDAYLRLKRFVEMFMPERADAVELYEGEEPIFDAYGIEDEIGRALSRKVPLPSGGYLILDQAEALTAIDVNTGRFVGKGSKDLEDTILKTNLEAVEEIAYQLRFRNIGGLIILDLIDMERSSNREKVRRRLEALLQKDKAKTTLNRISDLGLIEMTRKRTRESLGRLMNEPCFYCDGTGQLQSKETVAYSILRQIRRERHTLKGYSVVVNAHPAVVDLLKTEERAAVKNAEQRFMRRIELVPRKEYHLEQFDLQEK